MLIMTCIVDLRYIRSASTFTEALEYVNVSMNRRAAVRAATQRGQSALRLLGGAATNLLLHQFSRGRIVPNTALAAAFILAPNRQVDRYTTSSKYLHPDIAAAAKNFIQFKCYNGRILLPKYVRGQELQYLGHGICAHAKLSGTSIQCILPCGTALMITQGGRLFLHDWITYRSQYISEHYRSNSYVDDYGDETPAALDPACQYSPEIPWLTVYPHSSDFDQFAEAYAELTK